MKSKPRASYSFGYGFLWIGAWVLLIGLVIFALVLPAYLAPLPVLIVMLAAAGAGGE